MMKFSDMLKALALSSAILAGAFLASCNSNPAESSTSESSYESDSQTSSESVTETPSQNENNSEAQTESESSSVEPDKITYEEFVDQYGEIANNFALDQIETISYIKDSLSTSYTFKVSGDQITGMLVANVVKTGETERQVKVTEINFIPAIHVDDIANDTIPDNTAVTIVSDTKYSFDAKDEYIDQTTDIEDKLETVIKAELGDFASHEEQYIQESFAPKTVAELVGDEDFKETVNGVLTEKCFEKLINCCFTTGYDESKLIKAEWILEGDTEITGVSLFVHYKSSNSTSTYRLCKAELANNVTIEDFIAGQNLKIASVSNDYSLSYKTAVQGTRDALVNAIFEAYGMSKECPEGATRLIVDNGYALDSIGESNEFIVVEISNNGIKQFGIRIKQSSADQEYIDKLKDTSNYRICDTYNKDISLDGEVLDYTPITEVATVAAKTTDANSKTIVVASKKKQKTEEYTRSL